MPTTKIDNRVRIPPKLWKNYLDKCHDLSVDYHSTMVALLTYFVRYGELPGKPQTGNTYYAPTPIPDINPNDRPTSDKFVNELLSDDLFT